MSDVSIFQQMLSAGQIAFPKYDCTLTLKQQPDGKYSILLDGVELPIVAFDSFTPPRIPQREPLDGGGRVYIQAGPLQPGMLAITLMFTKLQVINGQGQPVEDHPYRREGLDL